MWPTIDVAQLGSVLTYLSFPTVIVLSYVSRDREQTCFKACQLVCILQPNKNKREKEDELVDHKTYNILNVNSYYKI